MSRSGDVRRALLAMLMGVIIATQMARSSAAVFVSGTKHIVVLRVYFHDYAANSRYTKAQVQDFFAKIGKLWGDQSSYGNIGIDAQVTDLFQLPGNRSDYIDTPPDAGGDLSSGPMYLRVLVDAIQNSPSGISWTNIDGVMVVMAETDPAKFHRGQGGKANLPMGPIVWWDPGTWFDWPLVGAAIFSENPNSSDAQVWGRWAHELGHAFQGGGPAHPSNYNSNFEQMDGNYPGQTGVFEKQGSVAFGWLPDAKYFIVKPSMGSATRLVYAQEYAPGSRPAEQAIKAYINEFGIGYYLISVRRRVLGDDVNDSFTPAGIPDEGVLIERVFEFGDPWVVIQGNPDRDKLWHEGQTYTNASDNLSIDVLQKFDADNYMIRVRYADKPGKPDVGINDWLEPPGNTYETTDIWVDSPVNGYGTFRYGTWPDLMGGTVPQGNGDDPAIGQVNRLYARARNYGGKTASNVVVHFDVTDPLGVGIAGSNGFVEIGSVSSAQFPGLASIPAGGSTDVYIDWTPNANLTQEQLAAGTFSFHSCVRVRFDHLSEEAIFINQDGDGEQENIAYFQAPPAGGPAPDASGYKHYIILRNDDLVHKKFFYVNYDHSQVPKGWKVNVNGGSGHLGLELEPNEARSIPVNIEPVDKMPLGHSARVTISASSLRLLVSDKNPNDKHPDFKQLGGLTLEGRAVARTKLVCSASRKDDGVEFKGTLAVSEPGKLNPKVPVFVQGVSSDGRFLKDQFALAQLRSDGGFTALVTPAKFERGICMFAGTATLASATSGYVEVGDTGARQLRQRPLK